VKRVVGERVLVEADVFTDGHDAVVAELLWKSLESKTWEIVPMKFLGNDHWSASFPVERLGRYQYTVRGWTDPYLTWQRDLEKRKQAGQDRRSADRQVARREIDRAPRRDVRAQPRGDRRSGPRALFDLVRALSAFPWFFF
jgi:starch synthase (maltosyl-transferring)